MNHHPTHPLIVIEGIDASGKATLTAALAKALGATTLAFPVYESPTGQALRAHLREEWGAAKVPPKHAHKTCGIDLRFINGEYVCDNCLVRRVVIDSGDSPAWPGADRLLFGNMPLNALVRQALMTANRCEAQTTILNMLSRGPVVLDRYWLSSLAYGEAEGLDPAWLRAVSAPLLQPDLTLILDIPVSEVAKRRPQARDKNETDLGLLARARDVYLRLAGTMPRTLLIFAGQPADEVWATALATVRRMLDVLAPDYNASADHFRIPRP